MVKKVVFCNCTSFNPIYKPKNLGVKEFVTGKVILY